MSEANLESTSVHFSDSSKFAETQNFASRNVTYVYLKEDKSRSKPNTRMVCSRKIVILFDFLLWFNYLSIERDEMMFAQGVELNIPDSNHLHIVLLKLSVLHHQVQILLVTLVIIFSYLEQPL